MSAKLIKSTMVVSTMTFLSRISGLVRDMIMAHLIGPGALADAFFVAFRIPNFLRRIFAEGAFSQAFVPVFSELLVADQQRTHAFINAVCGVLALTTFAVSLLGVVFAPEIITVFAPGFIEHPDKFSASVEALRIMFPYLFCISLVAMAAGILNSVDRFAVPAATPIMLNICMILAMLAMLPQFGDAAKVLAIAVMAAGILQVGVQIPSLVASGYLPKPSLKFGNSDVKRVFTLMGPAVISVSVAQINLLVNTFLASFLVTGSISWLYYSDRLMEFPIGVFGIALATVVLPNLSKKAGSGSAEKFSATIDWALRWVILIAVPASIALFQIAAPLITTLFQYNQFSTNDVAMTATALQAFAIGVTAFIMVKVLAPGFFAKQDTRTPMKIAVVSVCCNIVAAIILVQHMAHTGLALAISIAAWLNALLLYVGLLRHKFYKPSSPWFIYLSQIFVACCVMMAILAMINQPDQVWFDAGWLWRCGYLGLMVLLAAASYFSTLFIVGLRPRHFLLKFDSE